VPMAEAPNRYCCREDEAIMQRIEDGKREHSADFICITEHSSFDAVCLNVDVLRTAQFYLRQHGTDNIPSTDEE